MEIVLYVGQVSLYWIALYGCYALFLRGQTFLRWNRAYLLGSLLLSFALPLVQYPEAAPPMPVVYQVMPAQYAVVAAATPTSTLLTWSTLLWTIYALGVIVMALRLFRHIHSLLSFLRRGETIDMDGYTLTLSDDDRAGSFSFLRWVVISPTDYERNFDTILSHELVHVQQRHSWDIIFVEILQVVFWFNPVLGIYKKTLQQVHEYLADEAAMADNRSADRRDRYAEFLLSYALGERADRQPTVLLTNPFFTSKLLKNRIAMLYKTKNSNWSLGKYFAVALIIGFASLMVASCERDVVPSSANGEQVVKGTIHVTGIINTPDHKPLRGATVTDVEGKRSTITDAAGRFSLKVPAGNRHLGVNATDYGSMVLEVNPKYRNADYDIVMSSKNGKPNNAIFSPSADGQSVKVTVQTGEVDGETVFTVVEKSPEYPGGIEAMFKYLGENIKYPEPAVRANVSGKVFLNFVVTAEGEITDIQILKGLGFGADEESIRVVKNMPRWQPGMQDGKAVNVRYNLPISYQLEGKGKAGQIAPPPPPRELVFLSDDKTTFQLPTGPDQPRIMLDGVEVKNANPRPTFKADLIKNLVYRTGDDAARVYGEKGANGVVELSTKKK